MMFVIRRALTCLKKNPGNDGKRMHLAAFILGQISGITVVLGMRQSTAVSTTYMYGSHQKTDDSSDLMKPLMKPLQRLYFMSNKYPSFK